MSSQTDSQPRSPAKIYQDRQGLRQQRPATVGCLQAAEQRGSPFALFAQPEHCPKLRVAKCASTPGSIALPLQWSARSACSFLASALRSVITKRRHLALAAVGARTSLILPPTAPLPLIARTTILHEPRSAAHFTIRPRTRPSAGAAHDRPPSFAAAPSPALHSRRGAVRADSERP